jgi:hypothetical protein
MMLCDENYIFHSGRLQSLHPLFRIEFCWIKDFCIGGAIAPFAIEESVWAEVDDRAHLEVLPLDLLRGRLEVDGILGEERNAENGNYWEKMAQGSSERHGEKRSILRSRSA